MLTRHVATVMGECKIASSDNLTVECVDVRDNLVAGEGLSPVRLHIIHYEDEEYFLTIPSCHQLRVRVWVRKDVAVSLKVTLGDIRPDNIHVWFDSRFVVIHVT